MDKEISSYLVERLSVRKGRLFIMKWIDTGHEFDNLYYGFLSRENRIYDHEQLKTLPNYSGGDKRLKREWKNFSKTTDRFLSYMREKYKDEKTNILDLGCGCGWLANQLAHFENFNVYALDIIQELLLEASEVYDKPNLQFIYGNFYRDILPPNSFDVIVLSSTIEYFPNLNTLFSNCYKVLKPDGEIHIMNSPIYGNRKDSEKWERKSHNNFITKGFGLLKRHYFFHNKEDLAPYNPETLYEPKASTHGTMAQLFGPSDSPNVWMKIKKENLKF